MRLPSQSNVLKLRSFKRVVRANKDLSLNKHLPFGKISIELTFQGLEYLALKNQWLILQRMS